MPVWKGMLLFPLTGFQVFMGRFLGKAEFHPDLLKVEKGN